MIRFETWAETHDRVRARELRKAAARLRAVGHGATINGTYRMSPERALDAFRADLLLVVGQDDTGD